MVILVCRKCAMTIPACRRSVMVAPVCRRCDMVLPVFIRHAVVTAFTGDKLRGDVRGRDDLWM